MKKTLSILLVLLMTLCTLVSCGSSGDSGSTTGDNVIKVGVPGPYSGNSASQGEALKAACELAISEVNEEGIDIDGTKYALEPVYIDTENSAEVAVSAYTKLCTSEECDIIVGEASSSIALAVMDVIAEYQIPTIFAIPSSDELGVKVAENPDKYGTIWMIDPASGKMQDGILTFFEDATKSGLLPNEKKEIAIVSEDSDWGKSVRAAWVDKCDQIGWKITVDEVASTDDTDFYSILQKIKDADPDLIKIEFTSVTSGASITKQLDELGMGDYVVFGGYYMKQAEFPDLVGSLANYHLNIRESFSADYGKKMAEQYPNVSPTTAVWQYDAIHVAAEAYARAASIDKEAVNTAISETDYEGALMRTVFDPKDHFTISGVGYKFYGAAQYFDNSWTTIYPYETAEGEFQLKK